MSFHNTFVQLFVFESPSTDGTLSQDFKFYNCAKDATIMNNSDIGIDNFQSLIENYEAAIKDITDEIDSIQVEQNTIRNALNENSQLSSELNRVLAERPNCQFEHTFQESDLVENLKLQLKNVIEEKEHAIKLWQNAAETVDYLEGELKIYHDNTDGLVPKTKLLKLKNAYDEKINDLQNALTYTKNKLDETLNLKSKELKIKDEEIIGTLQSQDNTFKIIKNLEDEVLKLQQRLNEANKNKQHLEKSIKHKNDEIEALKIKNKECRMKVEEALQVVEAALNEKDSALLRENEAKEEIIQLTKTLSEIVDGTDAKIKNQIKAVKANYEEKLDRIQREFKTLQEEMKIKNMEIENYAKRCALLEQEIERLQKGRGYLDDNNTSKLLMLEKNLENTFQKLLLSEKQNIQLKSDKDNIKNDLDQMAVYYERDIKARDAEKNVLKNEIQKLKTELDENYLKASQNAEIINHLNEKVATMEVQFNQQIEEAKSSLQRSLLERKEMEATNNQFIEELHQQLKAQNEINRKWKKETKNITEQLEKRITELKSILSKNKLENRSLSERLKEANLKIEEYRKFLEMISHDVNKITSITLPSKEELNR